jgi:uncharacterized membrane protein YoaK (UPF0700 family)
MAALVLLLAGIGGYVDGVGFLVLYGMFTSHMSGNSVMTGVHAALRDWSLAWHHAFPIPIFVVGVMLGAALTAGLIQRGSRSILAITFGLETGVLALFMLAGSLAMQDGRLRMESWWSFYLLAGLLPLTMGFQNATLRRVGGTVVRTTFITGTLTSFGEDAAQYLFWLRDECRRGWPLAGLLRLSPRQPVFVRMSLFLGLWGCYVSGAVLGACAEQVWQLWSFVVPIGVLLGIVCLDEYRPIAVAK